jgi:hypothetical protein
MNDNRPVAHWSKKLSTNYISFIWAAARKALLEAGRQAEFDDMQKNIEGHTWTEQLKIMKRYVKFEGDYITDKQAEAR